MKTTCRLALAALLTLNGCSSPPEGAILSPDGTRWVSVRELPPQASKDQLLPTRQLLLGGRGWRRPLILLEDAENLCGIQAAWQDAGHLLLRVPALQAPLLRVQPGQTWGPVTLGVLLHEDAVLQQRWSADGELGLAVIRDCEQTHWNLYLRRRGEPLFNEAMKQGWDDPSVFGGFGWDQPVVSLQWTGPRRARILVQGSDHQVTLREQVGEVKVQWAFTNKATKADPVKGRPLPFVKVVPAPTL